MNDQPDLLEEYKASPTKSKSLNVVLVLSLLFIAALNFALYNDLRNFYFDWVTLVIAILVPAAGSVLLYLKKSAGWFIAVVYYSFIAVACLYAIAKWAIGVLPYLPDNYTIARQLLFGLLASAITVLLWIGGLRKFLKIKIWLCVTAIIVSILLIAATIFDLI